MENYTGDLSVEQELAAKDPPYERWARQYRVRDFGEEIPDILNGWWYKTCSGYLPHPVDEVMQIGNTRAFLFAGPEGTGRYTTAMTLAGDLKDRGFICYSLTGSAFDAWKGDSMEEAVRTLAVGLTETEDGKEELEGRTLILRFPEECKRPKRLQKALLAVLTYCAEMNLPLFLIVISENPSGLLSGLRRELLPCVFRLPDSEERRRFFRNYFENSGFRYEINGNAAIEKERRERLIESTEGFNYEQLWRVSRLSIIAVKEATLQKVVYVPEDAVREMQGMEFLYVEPDTLQQIVERVKDEESIAAKAAAPLVISQIQSAGLNSAAGGVPAQNPAASASFPSGGAAQNLPDGGRKKKQVSLAEMYRSITSELG